MLRIEAVMAGFSGRAHVIAGRASSRETRNLGFPDVQLHI
jgi:hypothetical protein